MDLEGTVFIEFQLQLCKGISYAAVATHADNCGRRKLAAMLVEHEPRSTKQVCLSKMNISLSDSHQQKRNVEVKLFLFPV